MYGVLRKKFRIVYDIDLFGKQPELYYKGKKKKVSFVGAFLTISYFVLYVIILIYKLIKLIKKEEVSFYETYVYTGGIPSINLTNENFYGGFALGNPPFIDETIYYPKVEFYRGVREGGIMKYVSEEIEVERCNLEKFGSRYKSLFKDQPIDSLYCVKNMNLLFEGYIYLEKHSYITVTFHKCNGTTKDGIECKDSSIINAYLYENALQFYIQDIDLTPQDYYSPTQACKKIMINPIYKHLYQKIYAYMQIVILETDEDIIGLKDFYKTENYLKYEESWVVSAPNEGRTFDELAPLCEINIQLSEKVLTQKRTFTKLIEIFGDVGGTMEFIFRVFTIIASFLTDKIYIASLINNLFFFNIDKKLIFIKEKQNNIKSQIKLDANRQICQKIPLPLKESRIIQNSGSKDMQLEVSWINRTLVPKRTKKKKKSNISKTSINSIEIKGISSRINANDKQNDDYNNQMTINEVDFNNQKINNQNDKDKNSNMESKSFINKIILNKLHFLLCYIFTKRKKNMKNILLEEAIRIIKDKLDIQNIFKKIYLQEINSLDINKNYIEMSDECKNKIKDYMNNNNNNLD